MEFRDMMWDLFISTGNLDAYLIYRSCINPDVRQMGLPESIYPLKIWQITQGQLYAKDEQPDEAK